ncbi:MAG TPA: amidohydrolase family protein [Patescibacteria group bacterium]|nr:amidohydrolase family protein [Patescibacteria group bacterium]
MAPEFNDRIDVHFHYLSPEYREQMIDAVGAWADGFPAPQWSADGALAMMDRFGIATGMLSVSSPGVHFGNDARARSLARSVNEFAARTIGEHRGRFGGFASLPLPDVDGALQELAYALDTLKLDGVVMLTNFNGVYLGDRRLDPVFDELNRRGAVVFIHPTSPICWQQSALGYPRPMIEFTFDSTRAVVNLIFSGTTTRCPKVRFIVPHAGGTLPFLARRIAMFARAGLAAGALNAEEHLRRLYYDLAGSPGSNALAPLLEMTERTHILYGSDYVHTPEAIVSAHLNELLGSKLLSADDFRAIARGNALALFPQLA